MKDRNVEFPNRFRMTKVEGTDDIYDLIPAPGEVIAPGDTFSKANMLPDSIPAALGLKMGNPQVKDALNVLANIGNVHVWQRVQTYAEPVPEVPAGYTLGPVETDVHISSLTSGNVGIRYGDSVTVSNNGTVSISNSRDANNSVSDWKYSAQYGELDGKFCTVYYENGSYVTKEVFFYPSGAYLRSDSNGLYATKLQRVTGYPYTPAIPAGTTTDYLTSTDRNAYPDQSAEGGQDASYVLGDVVIGSLSLYEYTTSKNYVNWDIASDLSISDDGTVSLVSPTSVSISPTSYTNANSMLGKYIQLKDDAYAMYTTITPGSVFYIPSDAGVSSGSPGGVNKVWLTKYQSVTGHAAIPSNTTITYLGQLGGGARIEVGSYVGTGTYGSSNPNTLTFDFVPKVVMLLFISAPVYGQNYAPTIDSLFQGSAYNPVMVTSMLTNSPQPNVGFMYNSNGGTNTYDYAWISSDKRTIYWYNTRGSTQQFNDLAYQTIPNTYHYVAIG